MKREGSEKEISTTSGINMGTFKMELAEGEKGVYIKNQWTVSDSVRPPPFDELSVVQLILFPRASSADGEPCRGAHERTCLLCAGCRNQKADPMWLLGAHILKVNFLFMFASYSPQVPSSYGCWCFP